MTAQEAKRELKTFFRIHATQPFPEFMQIALQALEAQSSGECEGCAFADVEEWEMPCAKCRRNCKDYWRAVKHD